MNWAFFGQLVGMIGALWLLNKIGNTITGHARLREEFDQFADDYDFMPEVKIQLTNPLAQMPKYARLGDAGADMFSVEDAVIYPDEWRVLSCGFRMELPEGWEAQVRSRSGLARKEGVLVLNSPGTVDSGYRGDMGVLLKNTSGKRVEIKVGDRIAQMVIARAPRARFVEATELGDSDRGAGGWGHSGK